MLKTDSRKCATVCYLNCYANSKYLLLVTLRIQTYSSSTVKLLFKTHPSFHGKSSDMLFNILFSLCFIFTTIYAYANFLL